MDNKTNDKVIEFFNVLDTVRGDIQPSKYLETVLPIIFYKYYSSKRQALINDELSFQTLDFDAKDTATLAKSYLSNLNEILSTDPAFIGVDYFFNSVSVDSKAIVILLKQIRTIEIDDLPYVFNTTFSNQEKRYSREDMFSYTPKGLNNLLVRLLLKDSKATATNVTMYDPTCGYGNSLISFANGVEECVQLFGQELNQLIARLAQMNIFMNIPNVNIFTRVVDGDTLLQPKFVSQGKVDTFDYIISQPPFNVPIDSDIVNDPYNRWDESYVKNLCNNAFILHITTSLNKTGKAAVVVLNALLSSKRTEDVAIRKYLLDQNILSGVVSLGAKLLNNTSFPVSVLLLDRSNSSSSTIKMIDAKNEISRLNQVQNELSQENIDRILNVFYSNEDIKNSSKSVVKSEIKQNNYNLSPSLYTNIHEEIVNNDILTIQLDDVVTFYKPIVSSEAIAKKYVTIADLSDEPFTSFIEGKALKDDFKASNYFLVDEPALLISSILPLRLGIVQASKSHPIWISKTIHAVHWNEKRIDINYLVMELMSEFSQNQLSIHFQTTSVPRINKVDLKDLLIRIPDLNDQNLSVQRLQFESAKLQYDKDKIASSNLQSTIDTLIKERMEEFQWDLHDIRNSELLAISQQVQILNKVMGKNKELNQIVVDPIKNINLETFIKRLMENTKLLSDKISTIYEFSGSNKNMKKIDIVSKTKEFMNQQKFIDLKNINYQLVTEAIDEAVEISGDIEVMFNEQDLEKILNNIVENVKRHSGFEKHEVSDNKFSIVFELTSKNQIKIVFLNSGDRTEVTPSVFFSRDRKWGDSGNSGLGGYAIKKLANRNNADVSIETYAEGEYVFSLTLLIERAYEFSL